MDPFILEQEVCEAIGAAGVVLGGLYTLLRAVLRRRRWRAPAHDVSRGQQPGVELAMSSPLEQWFTSTTTASLTVLGSHECRRCGASWSTTVILRDALAVRLPLYLCCPACGLTTE